MWNYNPLTVLVIQMPYHLSTRAIAQIEDALTDPAAVIDSTYIQQLATNHNTTIQTIYRHKKRIERALPVSRRSGGPKRVITHKIEQAIKALLDESPWTYQDEIVEFLFEVFDITVDQTTISKTLKRINITRKKLTIVAAQRSEELRIQWLDDLQQFTAEQIVCVDESGSDERTGDRIMGYADKGIRAKVSRWLQSRERVSFLPAYTIEGYITSITFLGTLNGDMFEDFIIDQLLPLCNPFPGPRSVIFMDNASVHHYSETRIIEACRRRNVWIRWLPPYSPDFHPVEGSFGDLKAFIRRTYRKEKGKHEIYRDYLEWAIRECGTGPDAARRARAHFRNAYIRGVPDN
jgi:transposase